MPSTISGHAGTNLERAGRRDFFSPGETALQIYLTESVHEVVLVVDKIENEMTDLCGD